MGRSNIIKKTLIKSKSNIIQDEVSGKESYPVFYFIGNYATT